MTNYNWAFFRNAGLAGLGALLLQGCVSLSSIESQTPSRTIYADADLVEWVDKLETYEDGKLRLGVMHDEENIYLAVNTANRSMIQSIMAGGLTVWFNSAADKTKEIGLKYPLGISDLTGGEQGRPREDARGELLAQTVNEMDLIFEEDKPLRSIVGSQGTFTAAASYDYGVFSVEFIIPRSSGMGSEFFLDTEDDIPFGIGIQTVDMSELRGQGGAGGSGGGGRGSGGRGGRGAGGGRGRTGGGGGSLLAPLDLWIKVDLSGN